MPVRKEYGQKKLSMTGSFETAHRHHHLLRWMAVVRTSIFAHSMNYMRPPFIWTETSIEADWGKQGLDLQLIGIKLKLCAIFCANTWTR